MDAPKKSGFMWAAPNHANPATAAKINSPSGISCVSQSMTDTHNSVNASRHMGMKE
jgi:hypothetical protein